MSRWLSQVNNLLESLDDQVEHVAEDGVPNVVHTVSARAKQFLTASNNTPSEESDESSSYQHVSAADQNVFSADSGESDEESEEEDEESSVEEDELEEESVGDMVPSSRAVQELPPAQVTSTSTTNSDDHLPSMSTITNEAAMEEDQNLSPASEASSDEQQQRETSPTAEPPSLPRTTSSAPMVAAQELQQANKKWSLKLESLKSQHDAERKALEQKQDKLEAQLASTKKELAAVSRELDQAADIVKQERKAAAEEREDLLVEQEEDLQQLKDEYEDKLTALRKQMKEQADHYEEKLSSQEEDFQAEGGNLASDLTKLRDREKLARSEVESLQETLAELQDGKRDLEQELRTAKSRAQEAEDRATTAEKASAAVEERLDVMQSSHQKQLQQRQLREAELERAVAELSQKVASAPISAAPPAATSARPSDEFKEMYEVAAEELVTVRTEAEEFKQRCFRLQDELTSLSEDHATQFQAYQGKLREYELQLQTLQVERVSAHKSSDEQTRMQQLSVELEEARKEVTTLSDQLVRQKGLTETTKSEVLALNGRLQVATARAEAAERMAHKDSGASADLEVGTATRRRRVKGGRARFGQLPTRSIRHSVGLRFGNSPFQQQVGATLDALDTWLLETGHLMRNEPLARLALAMYIVILHLWCFGLIAYHTVQSERTDFSALGDRSRIPRIHHPGSSIITDHP